MLKSSRLEEYKNIEKKNIIKDVRSPFRLKKLKEETNDAATEAIRNLFGLKKENKSIKVRITRDIGIVLSMRKDYWKPVRVSKLYGVTIILSIKAKTLEKHYQLKNILT